MKPGFKFFSFTGVAALLSCSLCVVEKCNAIGQSSQTTEQTVRAIGVFSTILAGSQYASAFPPSLFQRRLGSPMPQLGRPVSLNEEEDSDEDEDLLEDESQPRVEPHITPLNRDQCLAKLLCGMSVPVTGGNSKKNYYSEYATIVSKFFEAFPLDDEIQSKESIETYDDYSVEDESKPTRMNSRRKPLNSSRVEATAPTLQLFDLALVDVAKPGEISKNRTRKAAFEKVSTGNRVARARRIVENLGPKLQTVRQCQSIAGCPFSFKQLREKIKKKEAHRISSNIPLPPGPWPVNPKRKNEPTNTSFQPKPYEKPHSRPRPLPPNPKPESQSAELFSPEEPAFPFKDTNKGDDEMEEIFGPAPVSNKPLGFHQGVDENFNYEYNPDKPWRPGQAGGNSYGYRPWNSRPRPQPKPFSRPSNNNNGQNHRLPPRPLRPRPEGNTPVNQKRYPPRPQHKQQPNRRPAPSAPQIQHKKPDPVPTTTRSPFPKKKISYLNSPYKKPNNNGDDDEGSEDINKVAPFELIGNSEAGESEPAFKKKTTTTEKPEPVTESTTTPSSKKKKKNSDDESDEYDDDDNYDDDDYEEDEEALDNDEDDYSDEEEDDKESKKKEKRNKLKKKKEKKKEKDEEEEDEDKPSTTEAPSKQIKNFSKNQYFDDENEDIHEIWTKLNFATTGVNYTPPAKLKKKQKTRNGGESEDPTGVVSEEEDNDADDDVDEEEDEEGSSKISSQKVRASSSSASNEDEADDEVDEENASKPKRNRVKSKTKAKKTKPEKNDDEEVAVADDVEVPQESSAKQENGKDKKSKKTKKSKKKKKKAKPGSSEEEDEAAAARRKQFMMEIGGRPLVPKPDHDNSNAQKTSSLVSNRFKFQFINPYGPAPPSDVNLPGAYTPLRSSYGPTPASSGSFGSAAAAAVSSLPFKFKINAGPLGNLGGGGGGMVPLAGFPNIVSSSSASGSVEIPDPHHPPPSSGYIPPLQKSQHQQRQEHFGPQSGGSVGGSGLFNLNPLPAITKFFKRPSSGYDSLSGPDGKGPPPPNAFVHRPIGPESSHFKRDRPSPASGSSNSASNTKGATSNNKKSTKGKASKGRKGKF